MDIEELRGEKAYEAKLEMYEDIAHENKMREDSDYAFDCIIDSYADDIQKAYSLLKRVSEELFEYGIDMSEVDILKEI